MRLIVFATLLICTTATYLCAESGKEALVKHFQGSAEKTALDATWKSSTVFAVGVRDDGTRRDGYAQYVCLVLPDFGLSPAGTLIQIIDVVKLNSTGNWVTLGQTFCK